MKSGEVIGMRWNSNEAIIIVQILNRSDLPIHEMTVNLVWAQGAAWRTGEAMPASAATSCRGVILTVPPGTWEIELPGPDNSPMQGVLGAEVAFRDSSNVPWVRRVDGTLEEIPAAPLSYFGVPSPVQPLTLSTAREA